jgi:hypothetical protein
MGKISKHIFRVFLKILHKIDERRANLEYFVYAFMLKDQFCFQIFQTSYFSKIVFSLI